MSGVAGGPLGYPGNSDFDNAEALLEESRGFFNIAERIFDFFGLDRAAENLRRYRSGAGGTEVYSDEEIARYAPLMRAEDHNRTQFQTHTFTGRTNNPGLNSALLGLDSGSTYTFPDYWDSNVLYGDAPTYFAFGRTGVRSWGDFTASREGDRLRITGSVGHNFNPSERFDFNPGQLGSGSAQMLEAEGEANPFAMRFDRRQSVQADGTYHPDGSVTMESVTWGPIE